MPSSLTVAFQNDSTLQGNQDFGGSLGMEFTVNAPIVVYDLGAFNDGQIDMAASITVGIYDVETEQLISQLITLSGTAGTEIGSSRFETLDTSFLLNPGTYSIVAWGYDAATPSYNQVTGTQNSLLTTDSAGGAISFVGSGSSGAAGSFPTTAKDGSTTNAFAAGSFEYTPDAIALEYPTTLVGNQAFTGSLGMDFTVNSPVTIYDLGAFNDGQATMAAAITIGVYNVVTEQLVSQLVTLSGTAGSQVENSRFAALSSPIVLNSGEYSVVAWGYDAALQNFNQGTAATSGIIENTDGAISFVGSGRYGSAGAFPTSLDAGPADRYGAGSFEFTPNATIAATFTVTNETQLDSAIAAANAGTIATIEIENNLTLSSDPTAINGNATIVGNSHTIWGAYAHRGLMVLGGSVAISHLNLYGMVAAGGFGGAGLSGGGGGAGLGGGLFVGTGASVTLTNTIFYGDQAAGGPGGSAGGVSGVPASFFVGQGGGGGMGGRGGAGGYAASGAGGGGLGYQGYGQNGVRTQATKTVWKPEEVFTVKGVPVFAPQQYTAVTYGVGPGPGSGIAPNSAGFAAGGGAGGSFTQYYYKNYFEGHPVGSRYSNFHGGGSGSSSGGGGGAGNDISGGGGGGVGGGAGQTSTSDSSIPSAGGSGGFGGGGGGGSYKVVNTNTIVSAAGGNGGFGGGGGGFGGAGGFGGGGGGKGRYNVGAGGAGYGAGAGSTVISTVHTVNGGAGGGGLGAGGAVFVQAGGNLTFGAGLEDGDYAFGGTGGTNPYGQSAAASGQGLGGGIFFQTGYGVTSAVTLAPGAGQFLQITDSLLGGGAGNAHGTVVVAGAGIVFMFQPSTSVIDINAGATLEQLGDLSATGAFLNAGTLILEPASSTTITAAISALANGATNTFDDALEKLGSTTLTFANALYAEGIVDIAAGAVVLDSGTTPYAAGVHDNLFGALSGTGNVDLENGAILVLGFDAGDTSSAAIQPVTDFQGNITGAGAIVLQGASDQILGGSNAGAATILAGATLGLTDAGSQFPNGVIDNGTLILDAPGTLSLGPISGSGTIINAGSAVTLPSTPAGGFQGSLLINSGSVTVSGTIAGLTTVVDDGTLILQPSGNDTLHAATSGTGNVVFDGSGTTTLGTTLPVGGGVTIQSGALLLPGTLPTLGTAIVDSATLVFANAGTSAEYQSISGNGTIVQAGSGSLALTSLAGFAGALDATSGVLGITLGSTPHTISALAVTQATMALNHATLTAPSVSVTSGTLLLGGGILAAGTLGGSGGTIELGGGSLAVSAFAAGFADAVLGPGIFSVADNNMLQNTTTITGVSFGNNDALNNGGLVQGAVYAGTNFRLTNQANTQFLESGGPGNTTTSMGVILGGVSVAGAATLTNGGTIGGPVNMQSGSLSNLTHVSISYPTKSQYYRYSSAGIIQGSVSATGSLNFSNGGTITGSVYLGSGTITNSGFLNKEDHPATFLFTHISPGLFLGGISAAGSLALNNAGTIDGLVAMASGSVINAAAGSFNAPASGQYETITAGLLSGGISATGSLYLQNNGIIHNGVMLGSGTILNTLPDIVGNPVPSLLQGGITATGAVYVQNNSTITGGVTAGGAGTIINASTASIAGNILLEGTASSIDNTGSIAGNVTLTSGGTVFNGGLGTITSVYLSGPGEIINDNTIGAVTIGNGAILSSGSHGFSNSVNVGPGSEFTNIAAIATLIDAGSVTNSYAVIFGSKVGAEIVNVLTVSAGGYLTQTSGGIVNAYAHDLGTIVNQGVVEGGISVAPGGTLINQAGGLFEAANYRVNIAGTVINYGTLGGNLTIQSGGMLINHAANFTQGELADHGTVINDNTLTSTNFAAHIYAGSAFTNSAGAAISNVFQYGGTVINGGSAQNVSLRSDYPGIEPSFTNLSSGVLNGVQVGFHITLVDQGTLAGRTYIEFGGALSFGAGLAASANSQAQLFNKGTVLNSVASFGTITNTSYGLISGNVAMPVRGLNNQGTIQGNVTGSSTGLVTNTGRIFGSVEGAWTTGSNTGTITGNFLQTTASAGNYSISNAGIVGGEFGIYGSGTAVNKNGANVTGAGVLSGAYGTLAQYGAIHGGVSLTSNHERLILAATAQTSGTITGASASASNGDVLELQAGSATLNNVANFATIVFDSGANWVLGSGDTFFSGMVLSDATSLSVAGSLQNAAAISVPLTVRSGATLFNLGAITGAVTDAGALINGGYLESLTLTANSITNIAGGTIASPLTLSGTDGFLSNAGTLLAGVTLTGTGASVLNTGVIVGPVDVYGPSETVQTGGIIQGGVTLTGSSDELILLPGASFGAPVTGNAAATLALGAGYGTLTGLFGAISGFGSYVALAGAHWLLDGSFTNSGSLGFGGPGTVAIGGTLLNAGTLTSLGVAAGGVLVNQAGATIVGNLTDAGTLIDQGSVTGSVNLASGGQLTVAAGATIGGGVSAVGNGIGVTLSGTVVGAISVSGSSDVLSLASGYAIGGSSIQAGNTIELSAAAQTLTSVSLLGQMVQVAAGGAWTDNESGSSSNGISLSGGGSLTLTGSVALSNVQIANAALATSGTLTSPVTLGNGGVLLQAGSLNGAVSVVGNAATLLQYGAITGAISVTGTNDLIVLRPGETITGGITGGQGSTLELLAGVGTLGSVYGFSNIQVAAGASWTVLNSATLNGAAITGGGTLTAAQSLTIAGFVSNAATLNGALLIGGTLNDSGLIGGTIIDTGSVIDSGTIAAGITLAGSGALSIAGGTVTRAIAVTNNNATIAQTGVIIGPVTLSGHNDAVVLHSAGGFGGGVTGAADGSSSLDVVNSVSLANLGNYSHVPNIAAPAGVTLSIGSLASSESFSGAGTLSVQTLAGSATLTNAGYLAYGIRLTGNAALVNLSSGTLGGAGAGYRGSAHFGNTTSGAQTITNYGTMGRLGLGAGGVLQVAPGAVFAQPVYGYYGAAGSTLRLLSGQGTLSGFGDQLSTAHPAFYWSFNNFSTIDVAAGGTWSLPGAPVINDSLTVSGAGTLNLAQGLRDQGQVLNASGTYTLAGALTVSGTVTNAGAMQGGVTLAGAGMFINEAGGSFAGGGVSVTGTGQTIGNFATSSFSYSLFGHDRLIIGGNAAFNGTNAGGTGNTLEIAANGLLTLTDFNLPAGAAFSTLQIDTGATVATDASDVLWGVSVTGGGILLPQNFGTAGSVSLVAPGSLLAHGTIRGIGVFVPGGYSLTNASGGTIIATSATYGAVTGLHGAATIVNLGSLIGAAAGSGVKLLQGGMVSNLAGGMIGGGSIGIYEAGSTATVINAGTISGTTDAISLAATTTGELIVDAGAVFAGTVNGNAQSKVDFVAGSGTTTIAGLGAKYVGFGALQIDAGASRVLTGANTIGLGTTLLNSGTLLLAAGNTTTLVDAGILLGGITLGGTGDVLALAPGATLADAIVTGSGAVLELQSGAGTLHGLYGFTTIVADAGANWSLLNLPALSMGLTLTGAGTIDASSIASTNALNNSATLNASLHVGAVENYGVILGTLTSSGSIDNRGSIGAAETLTGSGGLYNHVAARISGSLTAAGNNATIINWGDISGSVVLSGHNDVVEVIGAGTYAGGAFTGGITGASDNSSSFYLPATNLDLSSLTLASFGNYTNVPNISIAAGVTLTIQTLDRHETFQGSGTLAVPYLTGGTLTNAGTMAAGITLSNDAHLINLPGATLAGYTSAGPYGGVVIKNITNAAQTITNLGTMGGVSLGAGGVLEVGPTGTFTQGAYAYHSGLDAYAGGAYGGTLRLLSGTGNITGFGDGQFWNHPQYARVYSFNNFNTIDVAAGGTWSLGGIPKIADSLLVSGAGTLNLAQGLTVENGTYQNFYATGLGFVPSYFERGALTVSGRLTNSGVLQGSVTLAGTGGFINLAGATLTGALAITAAGQTAGNLGEIEAGIALAGGDRLILGANALCPDGITYGTGSNTLEIVSGPFALTNFNAGGNTNFSTLQIDAGVSVTQDASDTLAGVALLNYGTIDLSAGFTAQSTLTNGGMLTGDVTLAGHAAITNAAGGTISGNGLAVIESQGGPASVFNAGIIDPATYGVYLPAGGTVTNAAGGTIEGTAIGVKIAGGAGTVLTAGTIIGGSGTAVSLAAGYANRVILDPGATFSGIVDGGTASTLELGSGSGTGTLSGLGSQYIGFNHVSIDSSAVWTLGGANTIGAATNFMNAGTLLLNNATLSDATTLQNNGKILLTSGSVTLAGLAGNGTVTIDAGTTLDVTGAIAGTETILFNGAGATLELEDPADVAGALADFTVLQTIDLAGVAPASVHYAATSGGLLEFTITGGNPESIPFPSGGPVTAVSDNNIGADVTALCFCKGTLIRTVRGNVPVEELAAGDLVRTWRGDKRPITWIGVGQVLATRGQRSAATPVIVRKHALGRGMPSRDLHVTKGHALFVDEVLIPVEFLVNHRSIIWDDRAQEVSLYHVELDAHDVMIANDAPAESYRDDGNRWLFQNANAAWDLPAKPPCAPVLTGGPIVDAVWRRLLDRAGARPKVPLTEDPDLHVIVNGERVDATAAHGIAHIFRLPSQRTAVRVVSRSSVPAELGTARDPRTLGIALRQIAVRQAGRFHVTEALAAILTDGFHAFEPDSGLRWTDGAATLPAALFEQFEGPVELILHVGGTITYLAETACEKAACRTWQP